ncbi:hypothetical protein BGX29_002354, partial [Mortierella sp. GBA35]
MANNNLTLFCLVDGESIPFSVKTSPNSTVDELKVSIHARLEIDTPSKDLTLWRVSIPVADDSDDDDDDDDLPIHLNNIPKNDKKKLKAVTSRVSDVFGNNPDEKMIHVI